MKNEQYIRRTGRHDIYLYMFYIYIDGCMSNVLISLDSDQELLLRRLAREWYGGKKGALSKVVHFGLGELAKKDHKRMAAQHQIALMKKGFDLGLHKKRAYVQRSDIYD